jgi:hypothetical protein
MPKPSWFPQQFDVAGTSIAAGVHPDAVLTALADRQHGVVATRQLRALGLTSRNIRSRIASGHLHPVGRGVHLVGRVTPAVATRRMAAVLVAGDGALLADLCAAGQLGGRVPVQRDVHLVVPPGRRVERPGLSVRRSVVLPHERTVAGGIPSLTMARVLLDVAAHRPQRVLEDLWRDAIYRKLLNDKALRRVLDEHVAEPGTVALRELIERRQVAIGDVANRMEAELRELIRNAGMPEPRANLRLDIGGVRLRPDLYLAERQLAFETDGRDGHGDPEQQVSDAERDRLYLSAGILPVRYGWWAVHYQAPAVLAMLTRFEAAWGRTRGRWTDRDPRPDLALSGSSAALAA